MARSKKTSLAARRGPEVLLDIHSEVDNANDKPDIRRLAAQAFLSSIRVTSPATLPPGRSTLLALPVEIRHMIYEHVFSTGTVDVATSSRVITIYKWTQFMLWDPTGRRHNYHANPSFEHKQLSILATCREMRQDALPLFWPKTILRFDNEIALERFLGISNNEDRDRDLAKQNGAILLQAFKVECDVTSIRTGILSRLKNLKQIAQQLDQPLRVDFISSASQRGDPKTGPQLKAGEIWHVEMMAMTSKAHSKQRMADTTVGDWMTTFKDDKRAAKHNEPPNENSLLPSFLVY
ncbi:hypothetical protein D6D02_06110 [Aureobasidium pullulans]|uniref:2EXR domain-containing protein n=1 Tax=Aureobasidium pullulans TaxID=5580 RepID=A0A4S8VE40_AURPU|nr:hypothetical protein D6D24_08383 [Aureobasidium pullulans]THY10869.1 hypothetical protein D6D02_06110 [Aureobasidium pullulans]